MSEVEAEAWLSTIRVFVAFVTVVPLVGVILGQILVYFLKEFGLLDKEQTP